MKNKIILNLVLGLMTSLTSYCYDDLEKGVDLSARTTVTGVLLNQLVDNATVRTNRGLIIATNNAPNVVANPRLKNYIWLDTSFEPPVIKTYSISLGEWVILTLAPNSVAETNIANFAITSVKLNDNSVTTRSISNNAVTVQKIMDAAITTDKILDNAVTRSKIYDGAIDGNKITNKVITSTHIIDGTITSNLIANSSINDTLIATNSVRWFHIGANEVTTYNITNNAVTSSKIADGNIHTNHLDNYLYNMTLFKNSYLIFRCLDATDPIPSTNILYKCGNIKDVSYIGKDTFLKVQVNFIENTKNRNYIIQTTPSVNYVGASGPYFPIIMVTNADTGYFQLWIAHSAGGAPYQHGPVYVTVTEVPGTD